MAAKRYLEGSSSSDPDHQSEKWMRTSKPSFASVIKEVVMINSMANFCSALEPLLRRVVKEEVDRGIRRARVLTRSSSLRIQAHEPSNLQLIFSKKLSLPIFTGSKIWDVEGNPLRLLLVDTTNNQNMVPNVLPSPIKIEIVVLDGDFPPENHITKWTSREFNNKIVKERTGKRPLLTGEVSVTMREGSVSVGDIEFTDNSSWIRSRRFRIGARVAYGSCEGVSILEAITETFVVKDHRGELYKKHHPPALEDDVWRLEKIGKDGAFHKKLRKEGIVTVQDFLKLSVVDPLKLKLILGMGMSEKMWEITIKHARTCVMGTKFYILKRPSNCAIFFNPICQVVKAMINGQFYSSHDIVGNTNRGYIDHLVKEAYANWDSLEQVDGPLCDIPLLTQGEEPVQIQDQILLLDKPVVSAEHVGSSNWMMDIPQNMYTPIENNAMYHNFADSPSDGGDLSPSISYISDV